MYTGKDNWNEFVRCCEKYPSVIYIMISDFAEMFFKTSLVEKIEGNEEGVEEELMLFAYSFIRKNVYLDDDTAEEIEKNYNYRYEQFTKNKQIFDTKKLCSSDDIAAFCYQYCTRKLYKDWKASEGHPEDVRLMVLSIKVPDYLEQLEEEGFFSGDDYINNFFEMFPKILEQKSNILNLFGVPDKENLTQDDFLDFEISSTPWFVANRPFWYTRYINKIKNVDKLILLCLTRFYKRWKNNSDLCSKIVGMSLTGTIDDFKDNVDVRDFAVVIKKKEFLNLFGLKKEKINLEKIIRKIMKSEKIEMKVDFSHDFTKAFTYEWILGYDIDLNNIILVLNPLVVIRISNGHTNFNESKIKHRVSLMQHFKYFLQESITFKFRRLMPVITGLLLGTGLIRIILSVFNNELVNLMGENMFNIFNKVFNIYAPISSLIVILLMIITFFDFE